jgi:small subunit ribosomal protein S10
MIHFQLRLKSFDMFLIHTALQYLSELTQLLEAVSSSPVILPQKYQKLTVLRSPHIDKKARDQFQKRTCKVLFECTFQESQKAHVFFELLKNSQFPGIQVEIHWKTLVKFIYSQLKSWHPCGAIEVIDQFHQKQYLVFQ